MKNNIRNNNPDHIWKMWLSERKMTKLDEQARSTFYEKTNLKRLEYTILQ